MTTTIAPDGALLDRFAEFTLEEKRRIQTLYWNDPLGYSDAVSKIIQALASPVVLVGGPRKSLEVTASLKEQLKRNGRFEASEFFSEDIRKQVRKSASRWLRQNWNSVVSALKDPNSSAATAIEGHLKREFYYWRVRKHPYWNPQRYTDEDLNLHLPLALLRKLTRKMGLFASGWNLELEDKQLAGWVEENVVSHFRIFGEYFLHVGSITDDEYLPAFTRSSLSFLTETSRNRLDRLIMPFVGLAAIKKVKARKDLMKRVIEWTETDGRSVVEGLSNLQQIFRGPGTESDRKRLLKEVEAVLTSNFPWWYRVTINYVRAPFEGIASHDDAATSLRRAQTLRWLWQIRSPSLLAEWDKRLKELIR